MALLRGPMISLRAAGGFAKTLTYAESLGRPYVKAWRAPRNPRSPRQLAIRSILGFCQNQWATLTTNSQETWAAVAEQRRISPFNHFCGYNTAAWRSFMGPTERFLHFRIFNRGWISTMNATATERNIEVRMFVTSVVFMWAIHVFRSQTPAFPAAWDNLVHTFRRTGGGWNSWTDGPLAPGTYYYRVGTSSTDGRFGTQPLIANATIV